MDYRSAAERDIPALCEIRKRQLLDEGIEPAENIDEELHRYFAQKLSDGSLVELLAEDGGRIVATAAVAFMAFPPPYTNPSGVKGYITNMYTDPAYRGRGIASTLLRMLTDEAKKRGVTHLWLKASVHGKPVYERFGFKGSERYMELDLD